MLIYESKVLLVSQLLTIGVWQVDTISDIINNLLGTDRPHPRFSANGSSFFHTTCTKQLEAIMNYASQAAWHQPDRVWTQLGSYGFAEPRVKRYCEPTSSR